LDGRFSLPNADERILVELPNLPLQGGCACGAVRYLITAPPLTFYLCHCTDCQRQTSSAFGQSLRVRAKDFSVEGTVRCTERVADSGALRQGWFCLHCGVRLWHGTRGSDELNVKAGTLDHTQWLIPAGHIWVRSRQQFVALPENGLVYEEQPEAGYARLKARWRAMTTPPLGRGDPNR
jgi:hypothetical protein